jgi:Domain of unknown function (DUF4114)
MCELAEQNALFCAGARKREGGGRGGGGASAPTKRPLREEKEETCVLTKASNPLRGQQAFSFFLLSLFARLLLEVVPSFLVKTMLRNLVVCLAISLLLPQVRARQACGACIPPPGVQNENIGQAFVDDVVFYSPESNPPPPAFISDQRQVPTVKFTRDGELRVIFLFEGAGYRNVVGWYNVSNPALQGTLFPDVNDACLNAGDYVSVNFKANDEIGFWLVANGECGGTDKFYSQAALNTVDGGRRHISAFVDLGRERMVFGFDDQRSAIWDNDFNDAMFALDISGGTIDFGNMAKACTETHCENGASCDFNTGTCDCSVSPTFAGKSCTTCACDDSKACTTDVCDQAYCTSTRWDRLCTPVNSACSFNNIPTCIPTTGVPTTGRPTTGVPTTGLPTTGTTGRATTGVATTTGGVGASTTDVPTTTGTTTAVPSTTNVVTTTGSGPGTTTAPGTTAPQATAQIVQTGGSAALPPLINSAHTLFAGALGLTCSLALVL